ncbi:MAG: zinc-binding dehydrogenase, partial [Xanthomonadales bacterium]|nr:zinc-binding dehydrogenase [Xanthomonadales bacterium]
EAVAALEGGFRGPPGRGADMMQSGELRPAVDRTYTLEETAEALRYSETGHARAKIVIKVR